MYLVEHICIKYILPIDSTNALRLVLQSSVQTLKRVAVMLVWDFRFELLPGHGNVKIVIFLIFL